MAASIIARWSSMLAVVLEEDGIGALDLSHSASHGDQ
jgi:hypothetical protein